MLHNYFSWSTKLCKNQNQDLYIVRLAYTNRRPLHVECDRGSVILSVDTMYVLCGNLTGASSEANLPLTE